MRLSKIILFLAPVSVFLFFSVCTAAHDPKTGNHNLRIIWAFGAIRASSNPPKVEPVRTRMALSSGDKLKMMVQISEKCFVYVIHKDTQGNLTMLFPYSIKQFDTDYQTARKYYVPKDDGWFQLDNRTGMETFYLIASDQRLLDIEYTYQQYDSSGASKKQDLAGQMLSELDQVKEKQPASPAQVEILAENEPLLRGFERATGEDPTDISRLAREISFETAYCETIEINHR